MRPIGNAKGAYWDERMSAFPLPSKLFLHVAVAAVWLYSKLMWRWEIEDDNRLLEGTRDSGAVIVMNHVSMLDPIIPYCRLFYAGRRTRAIYKDEFNSVPLVGSIITVIGGIPVKRGTADIKALRRAQRSLQAGESVLIFPEGTRVKSDDEPVTLHGGFALMAQMGKVPVIPMAIVGARDITLRGRHVPKPGKVWCKVGEPVSFDELEATGRKERIAEMERVAWERVLELRSELRDEHPGKS